MPRNVIVRLLALLAAVLLVAGCSSDNDGSGSEDGSSGGTAEVTVTDAWIKAVPSGTMTAVFAEVENGGDEAVTIESVTTDLSDRAELHHMVMSDGTMVMAPIEGGIEVPANGSVSLEPGGLHIMVMDLTDEVLVGAEHEITITLSTGDEVTFTAVAKDFAGGNESYDPDAGSEHSAAGSPGHGTSHGG